MAPPSLLATFSLPLAALFFCLGDMVVADTADNCYWRGNNTINAEPGWFACTNTQVNPGGAQLCCIDGAQCGEDSICHSVTGGWYVGGCTDATYGDPVCRTSCTDDDQTYIEYDQTDGVWQCCGNSGCGNGVTSDETFTAIAQSDWTALPLSQTSTAAATTTLSTTSSSVSSITSSGITATSTPTSSSTGRAGTGGLSTGVQAGIGVACGIAGLSIVAAITFWVLWRRRRVSETAQEPGDRWQQREQQPPPQMLQQSHPQYGNTVSQYADGAGYGGYLRPPAQQKPAYDPTGSPMSPQELANEGADRHELEVDQSVPHK
ncbi:hypothetical protein LTR36_005321 [Oleoguttula mirabilis]|uniref:Uncharacterized protein n=1 Tax=Oleoguttula mirabilis TaxID=1507867 RepID=A0AAV9JEY4_9PEZI|nr:hypothetical protein LTR36_005321 [Oleoguttula mirabilis]